MTWEQLAKEIESLTLEQKQQPVRVYEPYDDPVILYPQLLKPQIISYTDPNNLTIHPGEMVLSEVRRRYK